MEQLFNGFTLQLCDSAFPLSTDSIALSGFVRLPRQAKVLDLGSGCGTLGVLLCANDSNCSVTGIELDPQAHSTALQNANKNQISSRLYSICADIRDTASVIAPGSFHCCVSNPPYFSAGPQSKSHPIARHEQMCTLDDLFKAAAWSIHYGGDFFLVHKPERLAELCICAAKYKLEPKRLLLLHHRPGDPVSLILLQCRKGAKSGLIIEEEFLQDAHGNPSEYYRKLYHI